MSWYPESIPIKSAEAALKSRNRGHTLPKGGLGARHAAGIAENRAGGEGTKSPGRVDFPDVFSLHYSHLDPLFSGWKATGSRRR